MRDGLRRWSYDGKEVRQSFAVTNAHPLFSGGSSVITFIVSTFIVIHQPSGTRAFLLESLIYGAIVNAVYASSRNNDTMKNEE